jgi:hypothetical protein
MLWIMMTGGRAAAPTEKGKFARQVAMHLASRGVEDDVDVKDESQAFLWPERNSGRVDWATLDRLMIPS